MLSDDSQLKTTHSKAADRWSGFQKSEKVGFTRSFSASFTMLLACMTTPAASMDRRESSSRDNRDNRGSLGSQGDSEARKYEEKTTCLALLDLFSCCRRRGRYMSWRRLWCSDSSL